MNDKVQNPNESVNDKSVKYDIKERAFDFAVRCAQAVKRLPNNSAASEYGRQLIRSSASVGSNLEEADGTLSKKDFVNKIGISRREARESRYWLYLIQKVVPVPAILIKELIWLTNEAKEIMLILSSIINKVQTK